MALDLEIAGPVRELTSADVAPPASPPTLSRIRDSHHGLARALASGVTDTVASALTGYSPSRISNLKRDPAFQELLAVYRNDSSEAFQDVQARIMSLAVDAVQELHERLLDEPEGYRHADLLDLATKMLAHGGHGPMSRSQNVNVNVEIASRLEAARRRKRLEILDAAE